jgi:hypothetical protein
MPGGIINLSSLRVKTESGSRGSAMLYDEPMKDNNNASYDVSLLMLGGASIAVILVWLLA